ncbi:MAG: WG repeat-containing protein [Saprospiraceae bacterium]|nr:WG repeat-containing protein [Saprospiraceae bacterium]
MKNQLFVSFLIVLFLFNNAYSQTGNGLIPRKNNKGKYGYVDANGKKKIPYNYDYAESFIEEYAVVGLDNKFRYININGKYISDELFDLAWPFSQGIALVYRDGKYGYIDTTGKVLKNQWFDKAGLLFDNYAEAKLGKTNYLISFQGQVMNYGNNKMPRNETEIFAFVETMPSFPGGREMFFKYLQENLILKNKDKLDYTFINISFVVEKDGSLSSIEILKQSDENIKTEIINILKAMPPWIPGRQRGEIVRVKYSLPIRLDLRD